ncbi:hypothetical protein GQ600_16685 [Phytophthora cactorum]|nr:hypothetical protein GQ600_16685 [Phytophthora cactorum]
MAIFRYSTTTETVADMQEIMEALRVDDDDVMAPQPSYGAGGFERTHTRGCGVNSNVNLIATRMPRWTLTSSWPSWRISTRKNRACLGSASDNCHKMKLFSTGDRDTRSGPFIVIVDELPVNSSKWFATQVMAWDLKTESSRTVKSSHAIELLLRELWSVCTSAVALTTAFALVWLAGDFSDHAAWRGSDGNMATNKKFKLVHPCYSNGNLPERCSATAPCRRLRSSYQETHTTSGSLLPLTLADVAVEQQTLNLSQRKK